VKNIRAQISDVSKRKLIHATIVDVVGNRCSVRIGTIGKVLHGIPFTGGPGVTGDEVYIDYSSGQPIAQIFGRNTELPVTPNKINPKPAVMDLPPNSLGGGSGGGGYVPDHTHAFIDLEDAPSDGYSGNEGSFLVTKSSGSGIDFYTAEEAAALLGAIGSGSSLPLTTPGDMLYASGSASQGPNVAVQYTYSASSTKAGTDPQNVVNNTGIPWQANSTPVVGSWILADSGESRKHLWGMRLVQNTTADSEESDSCDSSTHVAQHVGSTAPDGTSVCVGQSFTGNGGELDSVEILMYKVGTGGPGTTKAHIYTHTGVWGSSGLPGTLLATSDTINNLDVTGTYAAHAMETFTFTGANKITLINGNHYFIVIEYNGTADSGNTVMFPVSPSASHSGNAIAGNFTTWAISAQSYDHPFSVNVDISDPIPYQATAYSVEYWDDDSEVFVLLENHVCPIYPGNEDEEWEFPEYPITNKIRLTATSGSGGTAQWAITLIEIYSVNEPELERLPIGNEGDHLVVSSGIPAWESQSIDLDDLADVDAPSPSDGQVLTWDDTEGEWVPMDSTGGASTFTELTDAPNSYFGQAGKVPVVKDTEDGLEFVDFPETSGSGTSGSSGGGGDLFWYIDGSIAQVTAVGQVVIASKAMTISKVIIHLKDTGSASSTIIDVNINGSSIFVTEPEIAYDDADNILIAVPDTTAIVENDIITVDIDQAATDAEGLTVCIVVSFEVSAPSSGEDASLVWLYQSFA
jgi:hypothetical protein